MRRPARFVLAILTAALWAAAPTPVRAQAVAFDPTSLTAMGNAVYFAGTRAAEGTELWKSDGSALGTVLVSDLRPGPDSSAPVNLTNIGGTLYLGANGSELWKSDGTAAGTTRVWDFRDPSSPSWTLYQVRPIAQLNGWILLTVSSRFTSCCLGIRLWATDGTTGGTESLGFFDGFGFSEHPVRLAPGLQGGSLFRRPEAGSGRATGRPRARCW